MHPSEWDALRAEDEQDHRDQTGPYAPAEPIGWPITQHAPTPSRWVSRSNTTNEDRL